MPKVWIDETGQKIPVNRITPLEKNKERHALKILKQAKALNHKLSEFKSYVEAASMEVFTEVMNEKNIKLDKRKGNFTWYNFNREIKIEINIHESIQFDEMLIEACKQKLMDFLKNNINSEISFVKDIVLSAFQTSHGKLDAKKVLSLLKYRNKIPDVRFQEAMSVLEESYRRVKSKMYSRIWILNSEGEYETIDLNYSSIKVQS